VLFIKRVLFNNLRYYTTPRSLIITYFIIKLLYLSIALIQIYVMNSLLSTKTHKFFGTEIIDSIFCGESDIRNQLVR
jgi:hypothetical protein